MKALVLAAGRGKRLGDRSDSGNKCMLRIGGKTVLEYNLERAATLGVDEIILVVGHRAEDIVNEYGIRYENTRIRYVIQPEQQGLVHAIECAKPALASDDFFLMLGDEVLVNSRHREMLSAFVSEDAFAMCGVVFEDDAAKIRRTYTVLTDNGNRIYRLIEKPKSPLGCLQGTGHCIFKNDILSYVERTPIHPERHERELPDLVQCAVDNGKTVKIFHICSRYANVNSEEDLKEAEELLSMERGQSI